MPYFVTGPVDPVKCAQFWVDNLYDFDEEHDCFALDNELIDAGEFWDQGKVCLFFDELHRLTDHPYERFWHYAGASPTGGGYRNRGPWNELEARGIRRWWSAYGKIPQSRTPDHEPSLQGSLTDWDIHQFTNRAPVYEGDPQRYLDGNVTKRSVRELFNF